MPRQDQKLYGPPMTRWVRRLRGAIGIGLTWATAWAAVGAIVAVLPGTFPPGVSPPLRWLLAFPAHFAVLGMVGGTALAVVLGAVEGRRRFDQMSLARFAVWGALGGLIMCATRGPVGWATASVLRSLGSVGANWSLTIPGSIVVLLGAGCAAGSLAVAQRKDTRELLEGRQQAIPPGPRRPNRTADLGT